MLVIFACQRLQTVYFFEIFKTFSGLFFVFELFNKNLEKKLSLSFDLKLY
jgi:hypothetical protein